MSLDLTEALQGTTHTDGENALTLKNTNFKQVRNLKVIICTQ